MGPRQAGSVCLVFGQYISEQTVQIGLMRSPDRELLYCFNNDAGRKTPRSGSEERAETHTGVRNLFYWFCIGWYLKLQPVYVYVVEEKL